MNIAEKNIVSFFVLHICNNKNPVNMKFTALLIVLAISTELFSQDNPAYKVFTGEGKKADYGDIVNAVIKADVIFFGELHDNPIAHWLELELTKSLYSEKGNKLILAAEMFERDNQLIIDEYLAGIIKESSFESEVRKWKNYSTDYKPLISFAKKNGLKFVASNIPRRYASLVAAGGFDTLTILLPEALKYLPPLPLEYDPELECYKNMLSMGAPAGAQDMKKINHNLPKAQAIKDAAMAESIAKNWKKGLTVIHYNGSYHSEKYMGIIWYLNRYEPSVKVATVTTVLQESVDRIEDENKGLADFIIVVPESMTRTY
jgi:uncharacterized iron-regulated protein